MDGWLEEQFQGLFSLSREEELFSAITRIALDLGFDYCAYGFQSPYPVSRPRVVTHNNYPARWKERYLERDYLSADPTVLHGQRSLLPVVWNDQLFASSRELWEEARSFGLKVGWAQSCRDANGAGGMLSLARSGEPLSRAELREKALKMSWLAQTSHLKMSALLTEKIMPKVNAALSGREVEVLKWSAEGKTSGEISDILNLSERTINFHIHNAMGKLNAANKTAAVVLATLTGRLS